MGKADNIKRAKKLKEAKRKREQDALIAAGLGPAAKTLKQRNDEKGITTIINQGKIKYSELLNSFVAPILEEADDISIIRTKFALGVFAWNAAILRDRDEEAFRKVKKEILELTPDIMEIEQLFDEMVKAKMEEYKEFTNIITDFEIKRSRGIDYDLTVATTPLKAI
ncbi:MAG: hypothetical protein NTY07_11810 [Bacteroidia bacterium]|nr:hypothetical protein [Bacteroidia bacterium]